VTHSIHSLYRRDIQVDTETAKVKEAHMALEQAIAAHKAATEASVEQRKSKLEDLATRIQNLQGKMKVLAGMSSGKTQVFESPIHPPASSTPSLIKVPIASKHLEDLSHSEKKAVRPSLHPPHTHSKALVGRKQGVLRKHVGAGRAKAFGMSRSGDDKARGEDVWMMLPKTRP